MDVNIFIGKDVPSLFTIKSFYIVKNTPLEKAMLFSKFSDVYETTPGNRGF